MSKAELLRDLQQLPGIYTEHSDAVEFTDDFISGLADAIEAYVDRRLAPVGSGSSWIDWSSEGTSNAWGLPNGLDPTTPILIRTRMGDSPQPIPASDVDWSQTGNPGDVTAYAVVTEHFNAEAVREALNNGQ